MAVNVTIEDHRSEHDPVAFVVPDGCRIIIRRCADGADVLVVPDGDASLPAKTIVPAGEAHRLSTWGVYARDEDRSFLLRLQDSHGREHDFVLSSQDLAGIGTAAFAMAGAPIPYEVARTRKMVAEAELAEAAVAALGLSNAGDDKPLVARTWALERVKDENGAPAFLVALRGDGRTVQAQLNGHVAATLCGRLGLMAADLLTELQKAR